MNHTQIEKGKIGEEFAASVYTHAGFEILRKDLRLGRAQVDLVVKRGNLICFVEVKFRKFIPQAHLAIHSSQLGRIANVAENFMQSYPEALWQIDAFLIDSNFNWQRIDNIPFAMQT